MNVLILGAAGRIAKHAIEFLMKEPDVQLTLFLRKPGRLKKSVSNNANIIEGDVVLDKKKLKEAIQGQDVVYANLDGEVDKQAVNIVQAMGETGVKRLVFITSLGIYDEVPGAFGKWNNRMVGKYLVPYRKAAEIIEASNLDYTILRPAWLTDEDEIDYETTEKNEPFKGTEVSRKSVAALVVDLIKNPKRKKRKSLGVNKPNTDGDKPSFY
ncbi:MAG TPA: SDR family oxidoreductase [Bacteroidales bacterium]|jgi:uncharacterized protein YbjT (DUF2867 family)|nr:SDR family oxidoreductase [Bacteroidales bacterium]